MLKKKMGYRICQENSIQVVLAQSPGKIYGYRTKCRLKYVCYNLETEKENYSESKAFYWDYKVTRV